jgi:hypothetical protein
LVVTAAVVLRLVLDSTSRQAPPVRAAALQPLVGRWVRADAPYVIEITRVLDDGTLQAAYFNPRPIHVARAEAQAAEGGASLQIELRDVNYPGSTYTLWYDGERDLLYGQYFQAVERLTFEVAFTRMPSGA